MKALIPQSLKQTLARYRVNRRFDTLLNEWTALRAALPSPANNPDSGDRLLIFPSDVNTLAGAVGDDAMVTASIEEFSARNGDLTVEIFCNPGAADKARALGYVPVPLPDAKDYVHALARQLSGGRYIATVILGADVLDGYYNIFSAARLLVTADVAARMNCPATILGASFNARPAPELAQVFDNLDPAVGLHIRDEISLERLNRFTTAHAKLVADSAFCLTPRNPDAASVAWIESQRAEGRTVIGINLHPMLMKKATPAEVDHLCASMTRALRRVSAGRKVSWLMMPHDYRGERGDGRCLKPVFEALSTDPEIHCHYLEAEQRAAAIKALAGLVDGVVTGRMHLAIAALGMGVPTLSLTYQDKFEGLYKHFTLPTDLLLAPAVFDEVATLTDRIEDFINRLPELAQTVVSRKPDVLALSKRNFEV